MKVMQIRKPLTDTIYEAKVLCNRCPLLQPEDILIGTWIWYSTEDWLLFSAKLAEIMGISKESYYTYSTFLEIVHGNDLVGFLDDMEELLNGGSPRWITFRIVRENNVVVKLRCFMETVRSEFGEVVDIVGVCFKSE